MEILKLQIALAELTLTILGIQITEAKATNLSLLKPDMPEIAYLSTMRQLEAFNGVLGEVLPPIFNKIFDCESGNKQFDENGQVIRSKTNDIGIAQIHEPLHKSEAEKMGLDIYTLSGNIKYAEFLYQTQGLKPWSASKFCWNK